MRDKQLTIVIPVREEAETISYTVEHLERLVKTPHILYIADDHIHSSDKTFDVVHTLQKKYKNIYWINKNSSNKSGFGPALCRAIKKVKTRYTVIVMSDSSDDAKTIDTMYKHIINTKSDILCGSRYGKGGRKIGGPPLQNILSWILNTILWVFGFPSHDATNAFKMYRTKFLQNILPKHPSSGVEFSLELSLIAHKHHATWRDLSTTWKGRKKGVSKVKLFSRGPKYLKLLFSSIFLYIRGMVFCDGTNEKTRQ